MRFGSIVKKAKDYLGNKENHGKINETIDKAQRQHGDKLGKHGEKVNNFVDTQQEKRFGAGDGTGGNPDQQPGQGGTPGQSGTSDQGGTEDPNRGR